MIRNILATAFGAEGQNGPLNFRPEYLRNLIRFFLLNCIRCVPIPGDFLLSPHAVIFTQKSVFRMRRATNRAPRVNTLKKSIQKAPRLP